MVALRQKPSKGKDRECCIQCTAHNTSKMQEWGENIIVTRDPFFLVTEIAVRLQKRTLSWDKLTYAQ